MDVGIRGAVEMAVNGAAAEVVGDTHCAVGLESICEWIDLLVSADAEGIRNNSDDG
jgi:hypothetical protein